MRSVLALTIFAVLATPALAQSNAQLKTATQLRSTAMAAGDSKGWAKYTTDDFMLTDVDGVLKTKQDRITEIEGHAAAAPRPADTDQKWRSYGNTMIYTARMVSADNHPERITTVWVKQRGTWKVAAVHVSNVPATPSP